MQSLLFLHAQNLMWNWSYIFGARFRNCVLYLRACVVFLQNFAKEFMFSDLRELDEDNIRMELKKAGGANYDAQVE